VIDLAHRTNSIDMLNGLSIAEALEMFLLVIGQGGLCNASFGSFRFVVSRSAKRVADKHP
jgi:hypothetical protein